MSLWDNGPATKMSRSLEFYYVPYPDRQAENIQSLIWAKREFRECTSGPRVTQDQRVSEKYFNIQVFFQRYLAAYRSVLLYFEPSCGKTGSYKCFQEYMKTTHPGAISTFYYFAGKAQINDFSEQVSLQFGNAITRGEFEKAVSNANNVKTIHNKRSTLIRKHMREEKFDMMTYGAFRKLVDKMDNAEVISTFHNAALFIDEVQFIKLDEDKDTSIKRDKDAAKESRKRVKIYNAFYRVARLCPDCTYVISTGTPVTNSVNDLIYQINLLPGKRLVRTTVSEGIAREMWERHKIPMPRDWVEINLLNPNQDELEEDLEDILRGRVMYARAPETDAVKTFLTDEVIEDLGDRFPFKDDADYDYENWREVGYDTTSHRILTTYTMSQFQSENYIREHENSTNIYASARQASIFVFPTEDYIKVATSKGAEEANKILGTGGIIGMKGFDHYCKEKREINKNATGTKTYTQRKDRWITSHVPTDSFRKYVRDKDLVKNSGIKIYEIIMHVLNPKVGPVCVASTLVHLTCVLIAVILSVHGATEYNPEVENIYRYGNLEPKTKKLRYSLLSAWNKNSHQEILRLLKHKDNVRGEYLKCILITPVSSVGLNIPSMEYVFIIDPPFTPAQLEQSEKRTLRPNSHLNSAEWAKKYWGSSRFPVYVFYMIAEPDESDKPPEDRVVRGGREWTMYVSMHDKDKINARVMHALKRIAIDAQANQGRNIRPSVIDGTPEADYLPAAYTPYDIDLTLPVDISTYNSYYAARELNIPKSKIYDYFMSIPAHSAATIQNMVDAFQGKYTEVELAIYLKGMVEGQVVPGTDAFGFEVRLNESVDVFYLTRELTRVSDRSLEYYSNFAPLRATRSLESVAMQFLDPEMIAYYIQEIEESKHHRDYISEHVPNVYKSKLLEDTLTEAYNRGTAKGLPLWMSRMLTTLFKLYMQLVTDNGQVIVHQVNSLYNGTGSGTNYNPVDSVLKASQQLRIMNVSQGLTWRECTEPEAQTYCRALNSRFSTELSSMYQEFKDVGCIGIIVRYDTVHIRRFDASGTIVENKGTGKSSGGFKLKALLPLMYRACAGGDGASETRVIRASSRMIEKIHNSMRQLGSNEAIAPEVLSTLSMQELEYYQTVIELVKTDSNYAPSRELCYCLQDIGAVYTVIGDPARTIPRIRSPRDERD